MASDAERSTGGCVTNKYRAALLTGAQIKAIPRPEPLVDGWLDRDSLAILYGRSGDLKTFLALDFAQHVATDLPWHGHYVESHGSVLYVIGEAASSIGARTDAWEQHHLSHSSDRLHWLPMPVRLFRPDEASDGMLIELAVELAPALIVFDTLARNAVSADENSARDMGEVVDRAHRIRSLTGACVLLVHHSGKTADAGMRGSSALFAAMDSVIKCEASDGRLTITNEKDKNHASGGKVRLKAQPVADSLVLVPQGDDDQTALRASDLAALECLRKIEVETGISATAWLQSSGMQSRTFYEARKRLVGRYLVMNIGTPHQPKYVTATTATALQNNCDRSPEITALQQRGSLDPAVVQSGAHPLHERARLRVGEGLDR